MVSNFKNLSPYNAVQYLAWIKSSRILTVLIMTLSIMCFGFASYASEELDLVKLKRSAEAGVPKSQLELALIYSEGRNGVRKNTEAAIKWFRLAASAGNSDAQVLLADAIRRGLGTQKDINEAIIWYKMAAENGNPMAFASLGQIYLEGEGVVKDITEALEWLKRGAEADNPYSQMRLGDSYLAGQGVERSKAEAERWYERAMTNLEHQRLLRLGNNYLFGEGIERNFVMSFRNFAETAKEE